MGADPTYMIRAVPSNASDNIYCTLLAHSAVHGAMAGYTGFTTGPVNGRHAYIPFHVSALFLLRFSSFGPLWGWMRALLFANLFGKQRITEMPNKVVITDRMWARLLSSTNQPSFLSSTDVEEAKRDEDEPPMQLLDARNDCCSILPPPNETP